MRVAGILCSMSRSSAGETRDAGDGGEPPSPSPSRAPLSRWSFTPLSGLVASSVDKEIGYCNYKFSLKLLGYDRLLIFS